MRRREFITVLGGAAVWPVSARAQQPERVRRIGVLLPGAADDVEFQTRVGAFQQGLQQAGWTIGRNVRIDTRWATTDAAEIRRHAAELAALAPDVILAHSDLIVTLAARHRLPAISIGRQFVARGGLISYGTNLADQFRRAADYVDRILKGAKPADLPVQAPTKFDLVINITTAKALGLTVPSALLARADEVIE